MTRTLVLVEVDYNPREDLEPTYMIDRALNNCHLHGFFHPAKVTLLADALATLPEDGATKSRDYGRGYAQAIRDVLEGT